MIGHRAKKLIRELWGDGTSLFDLNEFQVSFGPPPLRVSSSEMPRYDLRSIITDNSLKDLPCTDSGFVLFQKIDLAVNAK